ncbi:hypothetical protein [Mesorhizobium sp. ZC-5]|uniref:hypothetical protein n=1 Tax=Mesorhizobium sp. ZC-5 TaxID=2986066 RepID=UPI0021E80C9D|nr:hypothetical protein [Mesorhizobium sp. ZC-5]MCV3241955.1 hypothetical protein [Mesorhizobium sp. ZC-5]
MRSSIDPQRLALRGTFTVTLEADGQRVDIGCMPAFEHLTREAEPYDALHVQAVTNVPPEALRAAADLLCGGRRIAYHAWSGLAQHTNATQADRAVATLYALSGSFDRIGGNRIRRSPPYNPVNAFGYIPKEQMAKALGIRTADRPARNGLGHRPRPLPGCVGRRALQGARDDGVRDEPVAFAGG